MEDKMLQALVALVLLPSLAFGLIKVIFKLAKGFLGLILALVFLPLILGVGVFLILPFVLIGGFIALVLKAMPLVFSCLLVYFAYSYYKNTHKAW